MCVWTGRSVSKHVGVSSRIECQMSTFLSHHSSAWCFQSTCSIKQKGSVPSPPSFLFACPRTPSELFKQQTPVLPPSPTAGGYDAWSHKLTKLHISYLSRSLSPEWPVIMIITFLKNMHKYWLFSRTVFVSLSLKSRSALWCQSHAIDSLQRKCSKSAVLDRRAHTHESVCVLLTVSVH